MNREQEKIARRERARKGTPRNRGLRIVVSRGPRPATRREVAAVPPLGSLGLRAGTPDAWLAPWELDKMLLWPTGTIRGLIRDGVLRRGEHYVRKWGAGTPLLFWPAIIAWLAEGDEE